MCMASLTSHLMSYKNNTVTLLVLWVHYTSVLQHLGEMCPPAATLMYHSDANRVDICMRHTDHFIGIEFSFEHSYPLALEDGWWENF